MIADTLVAWWWVVAGTGALFGLTVGWHARGFWQRFCDAQDRQQRNEQQ